MTTSAGWPGLPILVTLAGRPVILVGEGDAADAKRRLLERAGATIVADHPDARLAIIAIDDEAEAAAAAARFRARSILVNAVDRPTLCDFTLPAVVDRAPVLVAVMTGGASAGLAAALRQRLEGLLPERLGELARELFHSRAELRARWPDPAERRRALAHGMAVGQPLDPLGEHHDDERVWYWLLTAGREDRGGTVRIVLTSPDPDDLTLRQARALASADRVTHRLGAPAAILDRARADAVRLATAAPLMDDAPGLTVDVGMA